MDHDAAWKRLFGLPVLIEHLLKGFATPVAEGLDFSRLRQQPANSVDADSRQLQGDAAWRVDYDDGSGRSLVWLVEFQSTVDMSMAARMHGYAEAARDRLRRQAETDADGEVRVLPMVLYSGDRLWNAWGGVAEIGVTAGDEACLAVRGAYLLLDANRRAREDLPRDNVVSAVFELNAAETPTVMADRMSAMPRGLHGDALRAMIDWIRAVFPKKFPQADAAGVIASLEREFPDIAKKEGTMMALAKRALEWEEEYGRQGFEKGLKQGLEQGLEQGEKRGIERGQAQGFEQAGGERTSRATWSGIERGQAQGFEQGLAAERELLRRLATRKFGAAAGDALVRHLADISDPDRLAGIGERIVDCGTGAELIERLDADRDGADAH